MPNSHFVTNRQNTLTNPRKTKTKNEPCHMAEKALEPAIFLNLRQEIKKNVIAQYNLSKNDVYLQFKDKKDWEC